MHTLDAEAKQKLSTVKSFLSSSAIVALEWSSHSFSQPITVLNYELFTAKHRNNANANFLLVMYSDV